MMKEDKYINNLEKNLNNCHLIFILVSFITQKQKNFKSIDNTYSKMMLYRINLSLDLM